MAGKYRQTWPPQDVIYVPLPLYNFYSIIKVWIAKITCFIPQLLIYMSIVFIWKNAFTFLSVCMSTTHLFIIHVCTQVHAMKYRHTVNTGIMCKHLHPSRYCYTDLHTDTCILGHMSRNICTYKYMYMHLPAHTYSIYVYTCLSISICISSCLSISIFIYLPVSLVCLSSYLPMYL